MSIKNILLSTIAAAGLAGGAIPLVLAQASTGSAPGTGSQTGAITQSPNDATGVNLSSSSGGTKSGGRPSSSSSSGGNSSGGHTHSSSSGASSSSSSGAMRSGYMSASSSSG
jgi:type II secretory pathway pseudopilin PulG